MKKLYAIAVAFALADCATSVMAKPVPHKVLKRVVKPNGGKAIEPTPVAAPPATFKERLQSFRHYIHLPHPGSWPLFHRKPAE